MLAIVDFSCVKTRPVPYPYIATLRRETLGEDVSTCNEGYAVFHWEDVIWRISKESPSPDPLPPIGDVELL